MKRLAVLLLLIAGCDERVESKPLSVTRVRFYDGKAHFWLNSPEFKACCGGPGIPCQVTLSEDGTCDVEIELTAEQHSALVNDLRDCDEFLGEARKAK